MLSLLLLILKDRRKILCSQHFCTTFCMQKKHDKVKKQHHAKFANNIDMPPDLCDESDFGDADDEPRVRNAWVHDSDEGSRLTDVLCSPSESVDVSDMTRALAGSGDESVAYAADLDSDAPSKPKAVRSVSRILPS